MSLSPANQDLHYVKLLAPSTFRQLLRQSPASSEPPKSKKVDSSQVVDSGHEETDDESSHTQPATPVASIEHGSDHHDASQDIVQDSDGPTAAESNTMRDADRVAVGSSSSPFSIEDNSFDHQYMSDSDLIEETFRRAQGYSKLSAITRRTWETERANTLFQEGKPKHFECSEHLLSGNPCSTLQEYLPSRTAARPVVSSFFGHNKREWNQIIKSVRVFLCRKCYQRYEHKLHPHLASIQLPLCRELIDRLERWRPGCLFKVKLTKAMEEKVARFEKKMKIEGSARRDVAAEIDAEDLEDQTSDVKRATKTPVLFAIELENRFGGNNKTTEELRALFDWLEAKLADETIEDLPAFEALLQTRTQDIQQLKVQQKRRPALKKALLMKVPAGLAAASHQPTKPKCTPTPASPEILSTFDGSRIIAPSALADSASRPRIVLKLGRSKKRSGDNALEEDSAASAKKAKLTESDDEVKDAKPHLPDGEVAEERTIDDSALASKAQQHVEVTDGSMHLTSLTFSNIKCVDAAPSS
ncbi:hypothetical protein KCU95_g16754, partial [Aureobasidium melanogenum]